MMSFLEGWKALCCPSKRAGREAMQRGAMARELGRQTTWRDGGHDHRGSQLAGIGFAAAAPPPDEERPQGHRDVDIGWSGPSAPAAVSVHQQVEEPSGFLLSDTPDDVDAPPRSAAALPPSDDEPPVVRTLSVSDNVNKYRARIASSANVSEDGASQAGDGDRASGRLALLHAARNNDSDRVRELLRGDGVDVNQQDENQVTPLIAACCQGHEENVISLLAAKADVNHADIDGVTPLMAAAFDGCSSICKRLIKAGAKIDAQDTVGCTALHIAVCNSPDIPRTAGHQETVAALLAAEADLNLPNNSGITPLQEAEHPGIVDLLRKAASAADTKRKKRMQRANTMHPTGREIRSAATLFMGMVELERSVKGQNQEKQVLQRNDTNARKRLEGRDKEDGDNALHTAAKHGKAEIVRLLCQDMVSDIDKLNFQDMTALYIAADLGRVEHVEALIEAGADSDLPCKDGKTPLNTAAGQGHLEVVALLCKEADVNQPDDRGLTPLHAAAAKGHEITAKALVSAGADLAATTATGRTALHVAAGSGHVGVARYLLEARASTEAKDYTGLTPLEVAIGNGHTEAQDLLRHASDSSSSSARWGGDPKTRPEQDAVSSQQPQQQPVVA